MNGRRSVVNTSRSFESINKTRQKPASSRRPDWDSTISNVSAYRSTLEDMERRKAKVQSTNKPNGKVDVYSRLYQNGSKLKVSSDSKQKELLKEMFCDEGTFWDAVTKSDKALSIVQDLFGDTSKKYRGLPRVTQAPSPPSRSRSSTTTASSQHTTDTGHPRRPNETTRGESCSQISIPLPSEEPEMKTSLDHVSAAVTRAAALNEFYQSSSRTSSSNISSENEEYCEEDAESRYPRTSQKQSDDLRRFRDFLELEKGRDKQDKQSRRKGGDEGVKGRRVKSCAGGSGDAATKPATEVSQQSRRTRHCRPQEEDAIVEDSNGSPVTAVEAAHEALVSASVSRKRHQRSHQVQSERRGARDELTKVLTCLVKALEHQESGGEEEEEERRGGELRELVMRLAGCIRRENQSPNGVTGGLQADVCRMTKLIDALTLELITANEKVESVTREFHDYRERTECQLEALKTSLEKMSNPVQLKADSQRSPKNGFPISSFQPQNVISSGVQHTPRFLAKRVEDPRIVEADGDSDLEDEINPDGGSKSTRLEILDQLAELHHEHELTQRRMEGLLKGQHNSKTNSTDRMITPT